MTFQFTNFQLTKFNKVKNHKIFDCQNYNLKQLLTMQKRNTSVSKSPAKQKNNLVQPSLPFVVQQPQLM
jgi:hypothetical protein